MQPGSKSYHVKRLMNAVFQPTLGALDLVEIHLIPMDPVALAQGRAKGSAYRASRVS